MASSVIHMCIANEVNKTLNRSNKAVLIGSVAPDIAKHLHMTKEKSHFLPDNSSIPNVKSFLNKYVNYLNSDDFVLGYYIHLYTDYIWDKYFTPKFISNGYLMTLDGRQLPINGKEKLKYFYNDYTSLNISLIDKYNLDLSIFYEALPNFRNIIKEVPMDKIQIIVDQAGIIIENSKKKKEYVFNMELINEFIEFSVNKIIQNLRNLGVAK